MTEGQFAPDKYVGPAYRQAEMYAGRVACCSLVSHREYADGTEKQTDGRQVVTLRYGRGHRDNWRHRWHRGHSAASDLRSEPTVTCLQYRGSGSILTAVGLFRSLAPRSGTLFQILSGTRRSAQTVSDVYLKRICLLDTNASSALELFALYKFTYLLIYLQWLTHTTSASLESLIYWRYTS